MARVLVTHASSAIGDQVIQRLLMSGYDVRGAVWSGIGEFPRGRSRIGLHAVDVDLLTSIERVLEGVESLVLITPTSREQARLALPLIECARTQGIGHVVKLSTLGSHVEPGFEFGRRHLEIERAIYLAGVPYTIVRSASFVQNLTSRWRQFIVGTTLCLPLDGGVVNWIDINDVADVLVAVLGRDEHFGKEYDVTGGKTLSGEDLARCASAMLGEMISYRDVSEDAARTILHATGADSWYVGSTLELLSLTRRGTTAMLSATIEHLLERDPTGAVTQGVV